MRILFITYHFAPFNHIGAVRCVKTAKYLAQSGDRVRVLAAANQPFPADLDVEVGPETVRLVPCRHLDRVAHAVQARNRDAATASSSGQSSRRKLLRGLYRGYKTAFWYPDNIALWRRPLLAAARRELHDFRPDVILASGPPFTPLVVAGQLSHESGVPWVCELRDLWVDNHGYQHPRWRRYFEAKLERRTLANAAALITVSEPLKQSLARKYSAPVHVVTNGFEPDDYPAADESAFPDDELAIVYTGFIYHERQDITPLLEAMAKLGSRCRIRLHLYGRGMESVLGQAKALGIAESVIGHGTVPYHAALRAQRGADMLLFLSWNDPKEVGIFSGKLFEYLGARRPILCVGHTTNVATDLVAERDAGYVSGSPDKLATFLERIYRQKRQDGRTPDLPATVGRGLTRREQVEKVRHVLADVVEA